MVREAQAELAVEGGFVVVVGIAEQLVRIADVADEFVDLVAGEPALALFPGAS
ncbi:hypothetical protein [Saccharopolyspora gloriosae]|uniref:hypothetical protein n=1 Tax=Saccharopolyspora gloriosae TaxID=455344 RepID=UPI001FB75A31|nr:hypothetical protein [Saccharopolyspora gloriosae]